MTKDHEGAMGDANSASETHDHEGVRTERTVAFFPDPRASTLLLTDTVASLIEILEIERGLVDLSSLPGLAVAAAFEEKNVPFDSLQYGQADHYIEWMSERDPVHNPVIEADAERLRALASGVKTLEVGDLGDVDANVILIPAMANNDAKLIDFSPETLPGAVMTQLEAGERPLMIIDTPERGLRQSFEGVYQRRIIHVGEGASED
jgi:hypothetical protein